MLNEILFLIWGYVNVNVCDFEWLIVFYEMFGFEIFCFGIFYFGFVCKDFCFLLVLMV